MNRNDLFPSRYFKASDLSGKPLAVVIEGAALEKLQDMKGGTVDKLVITFLKQQKKFVVNKTNFETIADAYGDETDDWAGKRLELYPTTARVGPRTVDAVRVRAPAAAAVKDSIPF